MKHSDANTNATLHAVENNSSTIANITTSNSTTTTNILTIVDSNPQDSIHNESVAILPTLLWEKEAMYNLKNGSMECNNPLNVPKTCCPGSFSQGGGVNPDMRIACAQADFSIVETLAQQFVDSWPLDISSTKSTTMCDICRILDILRQHNESLTIMGDSMTMQVFDGFLCEMMRRQYILVQQNETKRSRFDRGWGNIKSNETITIRSPYWPQNEVVHIQMIFIYSVPFDTYEETEEINQDGGILWFNFGLHDFQQDWPQFQTLMTSFFATLQENATYSLLLFCETTAQHFDIPNGMYSYHGHRSQTCTPLEWTDTVGKRDRTVLAAAQAAGYHIVSPNNVSLGKLQLVSMPYHNFTAQLHDSHPSVQDSNSLFHNDSVGECTHYCSSPLLWVPLWRTLRIALDTAYS